MYSARNSALVTAIMLWVTELWSKVRQHHGAWLVSAYVNGGQGADDVAAAVVAL